MSIDPPGELVAQAIVGGAGAASCSVLERGGELGYILREGEDATATVKFRVAGDPEARVRVLPLTWVLLVAAQGATIDEVSAPDLESYSWTASVVVVAERTLPAGLILPQPLRRRWLWLLAARDDRGMSGLLHSQDGSLSRYGPLGRVLADQVARTTIPGARGRLDRVRRWLDAESEGDPFSTIIAGTVAEYFSTPSAVAGADEGQALLVYEFTTFDPVARSWQTYAAFPPKRVEPARSRRAALSDRSLHALEVEVFGARPDAKKSSAQLVVLDAPVDGGGSGDAPSISEVMEGSDMTRTVEQRLELGELVARSGLSEREREVVGLKAADLTESEIAAKLAMTRGAVSSHWSRARRKLIEAAEEKPEDV